MLRRLRLSLLAALVLSACGGDPAPKAVEHPRPKVKKKKHKHDDDADAKADDADAKPAKSKADKRAELDREAEQERQERLDRQRKREEEAATEEQPAVASADEDSSSEAGSSSDEDAEAKKAAAEEARAQKKAALEEARAKKKAAADEKRAKKQAALEEAKAKKAAALEARKAKKNKKKKKASEDTETADSSDEESQKVASEEEAPEAEAAPEEDAPKPEKAKTPKKKKKSNKADAKAKKKVATKTEEPAEEETAKEEAKADDANIDMEETSTASIKDPSHDSDELDLTSEPTKKTDEEEIAPPPSLALDRRALTLGKSQLEVHGGLRTAVVTVSNGMGGSTSATSEGFALGATYGFASRGEVGFDYTLGLHPGNAKGPFTLRGAYRVKESDKLDIAIAAGFALDFVESTDIATMMTTTRTAKGLEVGIWARYHAGAKLSVFTGLPGLPSSTGSLSAIAALPPLPYQLSIGLGSKDAIGLDVPVGAGYQATPNIYAFAILDLAHLGMSNSDSAFVFADFIPLALGGFYTTRKIDIGAVFGDDLKQGADYLHFDVVARYSLK